MRSFRLKSSVIATAAGSALVMAAFVANPMTQTPDSARAAKGDRLETATKIAYPDARINAAFDTIVDSDNEVGVTTLTRIPRTDD
ncbi:MAG: hypothetical protein AcusKO_11930 [Acuticoccus sp.]